MADYGLNMRRNRPLLRRLAPNGRADVAAALDGRARAPSDTETGLLKRQWASITHTLIKASQCRHSELQRQAASKYSLPPAVQGRTSDPSPSTPLLTLDAGGTGSMDSTDSVTYRISQTETSIKISGQLRLPSSQSESVMDEKPLFRSVLEGYDSDDDDPKKMLAQLEQGGATVSRFGENGSTAVPAQKDQAEPVTSHELFAGAREMLADLGQTAPRSPRRNNDEEDIDPAQMLADFGHTSLAVQSTFGDEAEALDPAQKLADIQSCFSVLDVTATEGDDDDGLKAMFARLETRTYAISRDDQKMLQADVAQKSPQAQDDHSKNVHEELEALHERLTNTKTFSPDPSSITQQIKTAQSSNDGFSDGLERAISPYVIALQLEKAGLPWEQLRGWTTYLFSSGLDGHEACQEKDKIVQLATDELDAIIKQTLRDESRYLEAENLARLPCRVVVSNIAAGADEDDLKEFFYPLRYQVQKLNVLPDRDPIKRTQVAHIDMYTRETAIRASYMIGSIFGLLPDIKLAVEKED